MAVDLDKIASHYLAPLTARRSRAILVPIIVIAVIFTLISITDRAYQQPSINIERASETEDITDWSKFAYIQYATSSEHLCNAVMLLQSLHHLKSRADRVLMYAAEMLPDPKDMDGGGSQEGELLVKVRDEYGVKLVPIQVQHGDTADGACILTLHG
ncbi:uncharacterized protein TrAtP1_012928 [Trichoderma atroviride]|uniref:uncharacterized protein n=1 Tax=Hypocrea atroviridis TaxID=63577 RepID=UPI00332EE695|nr:hypothetical protein TrAtP1_012928 [Trichoderma atroviride]